MCMKPVDPATLLAERMPLDVWGKGFADHPSVRPLIEGFTNIAAEHVAISEHHAAGFILNDVIQRRRWLRLRGMSLTTDSIGRSLEKRARALSLDERALKKIRGAFRRPPGERVYRIYLNTPELQAIYPLALMPLGQAHFITWLTSHGRADFKLSSEEILWFLYQSDAELERGLTLTYLLRPTWQEAFPLALTPQGWGPFVQLLKDAYGEYFRASAFRKLPHTLSSADQQTLEARHAEPVASTRTVSGVNVLSHFCNPSGIQQAALWTKAALERAGLRTSCRDVPVPRHLIPADRERWLGLEIHPVTILTHAATPYFINAYERAGLYRRPDVYRIAYWAWELERVPDEWVEAAAHVNEIWAPTPFVADAMRAAMPVPVYDMLPGVEIGAVEHVARAEFGIAPDDFVFLFMFDLHSQIHRKNPGALVGAFKQAFRADDAATLVIKATGGDIFTKDFEMLRAMCAADKIVLIDEVMSRERAYGMIEMCDCFVSLHRSEGFGLGLAEAMLLGKPVIATGYSGNLAFMNAENSLLVDYEMVEIAEDRPIYTRGNRWAEPSVTHAAALMRQVYENREAAVANALRVKPQITAALSLAEAGNRMRRRLQSIVGS